jgi:hypothetical protein
MTIQRKKLSDAAPCRYTCDNCWSKLKQRLYCDVLLHIHSAASISVVNGR